MPATGQLSRPEFRHSSGGGGNAHSVFVVLRTMTGSLDSARKSVSRASLEMTLRFKELENQALPIASALPT